MGKTARVPFRAHVRSRTRDHPEFHFRDQLDEILKLAQVRAAFLRFVIVPENVSFDGIESRPPEFLQAVAPQLARAAWIVERGAEYESVFVVDDEAIGVVANQVWVFELVLALVRRKNGKSTPARNAQGCGEWRAESGLEKASSRGFHKN